MKVVINKCFGGFGLSKAAYDRLIELGVPDITKSVIDGGWYKSWSEIERTDPRLVRVVEELGPAASGTLAKLKVVEIPDGIDFEIGEYDGVEHIAEKHRTWE